MTGISEKSKKMVANSSNKGFKYAALWFKCFSLAGKKVINKTQYYSFGLENTFSLIGMKDSLSNIWDNGTKWFSLARKSVTTSKNKLSLKIDFQS